MNFPGIENFGEFYSHHYLSELLEGDLKGLHKQWKTDAKEKGTPNPVTQFGAIGEPFFRAMLSSKHADSEELRATLATEFHSKLLHTLGFIPEPQVREIDNLGLIPLLASSQKDGQPFVWIIESVLSDGTDEFDAFDALFSFEKEETNTDLTYKEIISAITKSENPPRWILFLGGGTLTLIDRHKWGKGKFLQFSLSELFSRKDNTALKAAIGLLHIDAINPEGKTSLLDTLDENAHKHAYGVSTDLKYGAQRAIDLLANEVVYYRGSIQKQAIYNDAFADQLTHDCLIYLYRLLFLFYVEARGALLGVVPMDSDTYRQGYSLESLRDLELIPLTTDQARNGKYIYHSLEKLFKLVNIGKHFRQMDLESMHDTFEVPGMRSPVFDPERTPMLKGVKFRNHVLQEVIRLLSLSAEKKGAKNRGRVSYATLGINQLGAVYEGLLSYSGFFAKEDTYEVRNKKEIDDPNAKTFYVPASKIAAYEDSEIVRIENGDPLIHPKGKYIFRLAGRDREKSASYYTPEVLTKTLTEYTLKERLGEKFGENFPANRPAMSADEILTLTICEPAMGSGAFLNEAINQLADKYLEKKQAELGIDIPQDEYQFEKQRVKMHFAVHNCYGVDLNPMAAELGKISMWLNVLHKGIRAPFFDLRIKTGNSLIGAKMAAFPEKMLSAKTKGKRWYENVPTSVVQEDKLPLPLGDESMDGFGRATPRTAKAEGWGLQGSAAVEGDENRQVAQKEKPVNNLTNPNNLQAKTETLTLTLSQRERGLDGSQKEKPPLPLGEGWGEGLRIKQVDQTEQKTIRIPSHLLAYAKQLRSNQTDAEKLLWHFLRNRNLADSKFRRQHTIGNYIVDFYCHEKQIVIELDGSQHLKEKSKTYDEKRTAYLSDEGIRVLRFNNIEMLTQTEAVLESIFAAITKLPLPQDWGLQGSSAVEGDQTQQVLQENTKIENPQAKTKTQDGILHFLLPDPGMVSFDKDKVIKSLVPEKIKTIKAWKKEQIQPIEEKDLSQLRILTQKCKDLFKQHKAERKNVLKITRQPIHIWGQKEPAGFPLDIEASETHARALSNPNAPGKKLKLAMDYWCSLYFWPLANVEDLPTRAQWLDDIEHVLSSSDLEKTVSSSTRLQIVNALADKSIQVIKSPLLGEKEKIPSPFGRGKGEGRHGEQVDQEKKPPLPLGEGWGLQGSSAVEGDEGKQVAQKDQNANRITNPNNPLAKTKTLTLALSQRERGLEDSKQVDQNNLSSHHFHHWDLAFPEINSFDVILGNPPWVKLEWKEQGVLSDYDPLIGIRKLSAKQTADIRQATFDENALAESEYFSEFEGQTGGKSFLNAFQNYSWLKGVQTNLYKNFLQRTGEISKQGTVGLVHPEGVFDDPKGGELRRRLFERMSAHFQFGNSLKLFEEIHDQVKYSLSIYGFSADSFLSISNLFHPKTIENSFKNDVFGVVPGIKNASGKWDLRGHPSRIINVGYEQLEMFAKLFDKENTPFNQARLPVLHSQELLEVLKKFADAPRKLGDLKDQYYSTEHFHETNQQKDGTIKRETRFPKDVSEWIISGPHFYVANPFNKTPREGCSHNQDYEAIDLTSIPDDYLPRTNYVPACSPEEYLKRTPHWNGRPVTDFYRFSNREFVPPTGERTMVPIISPPGVSHINGVYSTLFDPKNLLNFSAFCASIVCDFFIKSNGMGHINANVLEKLPIPKLTVESHQRILRSNAVCGLYRPLVEENYKGEFVWTKDDSRLMDFTFTGHWHDSFPLRTMYERRQALVELDALAAIALGITSDELCNIYRIQFPVLYQNENETFYDQRGHVVFTISKGLTGVGLTRKEWTEVKDAKVGETLPEWAVDNADRAFIPPFDKCDREADMRQAYDFFKGEKK